MHIPDGYLSPMISLGAGVLTLPAWAVATQRVKAVLNNRTIPLLAIFSALTFTIMMFNVPVPGGTTAHGVGGTITAIILGPWAAVISVSVALIIQALFFGDGGVLAILINCFNMGVVLPFVAYWTYRLIAARAPILGGRRVVAAGIGGWVGMTAAALLVGIELGIQPLLFTNANGVALYSPYGLAEAVPAMLIAHVFGASIVEGLIGAVGVAYFQKRHPEYLTSLRSVFATDDAPEGAVSPRPLWQLVSAIIIVGIAAAAILGLVLGGGDPGHWFGSDWSQVDWAAVASMLLVVAVLFAVLVPLAYLVLPRAWKRVGTAFVALAVIAPLGLIAPGLRLWRRQHGRREGRLRVYPAGPPGPVVGVQRAAWRVQHPAPLLQRRERRLVARSDRLRDHRDRGDAPVRWRRDAHRPPPRPVELDHGPIRGMIVP